MDVYQEAWNELTQTVNPIGLGMAVIVFIGIVAFFLWANKSHAQRLEKHMAAHQIEGEIKPLYFLPFRLWVKHRKGDSWKKVARADGTLQYARIRLSSIDLLN